MVDGATQNRCHSHLSITDNGVRGLRDLTTDQLASLVKASLREFAGRFPGSREMPLPDGIKIITTTDLALATYWDISGCPIIGIRPNQDPRAGRYQMAEFVHADYEGAADRLALLFVSSKEATYQQRMGILKKEAIRVRDMGKNR